MQKYYCTEYQIRLRNYLIIHSNLNITELLQTDYLKQKAVVTLSSSGKKLFWRIDFTA